MKKSLLTILLLTTLSASHAQYQQLIDSMNQVISSLPDDTTKSLAICQTGLYYLRVNMDSAEAYGQRALQLAKKLDHDASIASAYRVLSERAFYQGEYEAAGNQARNSIRYAERMAHKKVLSRALLSIIKVEATIGRLDSAIYYGKKAVQSSQETEDFAILSFAYESIGITFRKMAMLDSAVYYQLLALDVKEKHNINSNLHSLLYNIGGLYLSLDKYDEALEHYNRALEICKQNGDNNLPPYIYTGLATTMRHLKDYEKAIENALEGLRLAEANNNTQIIVDFQEELGKTYVAMGDFNEAQQYLERAVELAQSITDAERYPKLLIEIAGNEARLGRLNAAKNHLDTGILICRQKGLLEHLADGYFLQQQIDSINGDYLGAYQSLKKFRAIEDSIFTLEKMATIEDLQTQYETEKKDKEIAQGRADVAEEKQQNAELKTSVLRRNFVLGALGGLLAIGTYFFYQERNRRKKEQQLHVARQALLESEQATLKAEMESKNRELAAKAVCVIKKNELLTDIKGKLKESLRRVDGHSADNFKVLDRSIDANLNLDKDWEDFRFHFEKSYPDFLHKLEVAHPNLTEYDRKLCAYFLIGLPIKEVAEAMSIAYSSARTSRTRLRKKLEIEPDVDLNEFLKAV